MRHTGSAIRTLTMPNGKTVRVMREDAYDRGLKAAAKVIREIEQRRAGCENSYALYVRQDSTLD